MTGDAATGDRRQVSADMGLAERKEDEAMPRVKGLDPRSGDGGDQAWTGGTELEEEDRGGDAWQCLGRWLGNRGGRTRRSGCARRQAYLWPQKAWTTWKPRATAVSASHT